MMAGSRADLTAEAVEEQNRIRAISTASNVREDQVIKAVREVRASCLGERVQGPCWKPLPKAIKEGVSQTRKPPRLRKTG